jgi:hypothetical protein
VISANARGETLNLRGIEVIDRDRNTDATELGDELCRFFDRLWTVVVRPELSRAATAAGADDGRAGFTQRRRDATPRASCRPRHNGDSAAQRVRIR